MEPITSRLAGATLVPEEGGVSARQLVLGRDLVVRAQEMGPGVLRSHRALMRFLAVRIPKEDLLFPEAGLPEGIYQRIV